MSDIVPIISNGDRAPVLAQIARERKVRPDFSVIDVGGTVVGWSGGVADAIVDINPPLSNPDSRILYFKVIYLP